jgi:hypothetical protein
LIDQTISKCKAYVTEAQEILENSGSSELNILILDLIHRGLSQKVIDFDTVLTLIDKYQETQEITEQYSRFLDEGVKNIPFDEFKDFMEKTFPLLNSKKLLKENELLQIKETFQEAKNIIRRWKVLRNKKEKELEAFFTKHEHFNKISIPEVQELKYRLIILRILDETSKPEPMPTWNSLTEVENILKNLNSNSSDYQGIDCKKARTIIDLKLKYTRKILKKFSINNFEGLEQIISTLHKDQGIIPKNLLQKHTNWKLCAIWYERSKSIIKQKVNEDQVPDYLLRWEDLHQTFNLQEIDQLIRNSKDINQFQGDQPTRLFKLLWRWKLESIRTENSAQLTTLEARWRDQLVNWLEYIKLRDEPKVKELFQKYFEKRDNKILGVINSLAVTNIPVSLMQENKDDEFKLLKINIEMHELINSIVNRSSIKLGLIDSEYDFNETNHQNQAHILYSVLKNKIYDEANWFWVKFIHSQLHLYEKWQSQMKRYLMWKSRMNGKMDSWLVSVQEGFSETKVKFELQYPTSELIFDWKEDVDALSKDLSEVDEWIQQAEDVIKMIDLSDYKNLKFSEETSKNLEDLVNKMICLPIISDEKKNIFEKIYLLNWFSKVSQLFAKDSDKNKKGDKDNLKRPFEDWKEFNEKIQPFASREEVTDSKLYKMFAFNFSKAKKLVKSIDLSKGKWNSKIEAEDFEKIIKDAKWWKVNLTYEIEQSCERFLRFSQLVDEIPKLKKSKANIKKFDDLLKQLSTLPFKNEEAFSKIKQVQAAYQKTIEELNKNSGSFGSKPKYSVAKEFERKCMSLNFSFDEMKILLKLIKENEAKFEKIRTLEKEITEKSHANWESLQEILLEINSLSFDFELEEEKMRDSLNKVKLNCFLETFKTEFKKKKFQIKISCTELIKLIKEFKEINDISKNPEKSENMVIVEKVEEYIKTIEKKIKAIKDNDKLEKFEKEGSILVDYSDFTLERRKQLRDEKLKEERKMRNSKNSSILESTNSTKKELFQIKNKSAAKLTSKGYNKDDKKKVKSKARDEIIDTEESDHANSTFSVKKRDKKKKQKEISASKSKVTKSHHKSNIKPLCGLKNSAFIMQSNKKTSSAFKKKKKTN